MRTKVIDWMIVLVINLLIVGQSISLHYQVMVECIYISNVHYLLCLCIIQVLILLGLLSLLLLLLLLFLLLCTFLSPSSFISFICFTTAWVQNPAWACEKVANDFSPGTPVSSTTYNWLVTN